MGISLKTHKIVWARSGGKCAICKNDLLIDPTNLEDDPSIVGDEAHIVARTETFTRGDYDSLSVAERDHYSNLILLCKVHHKQIDDQLAEYTVERLRAIKAAHEAEVRQHWTAEDARKQNDDFIYSGYIDEWSSRSKLDDWRGISSYLSVDTPCLPRDWYEAQREFITWLIGRIWPGRYPRLENALHNYRAVLQDLLNVFDRHVEYDRDRGDTIRTKKFYRIDEWNEELHKKLVAEYDAHVNLVNDLFFELTRAANYVCDRVRENLFEGYRMVEGALLVERHDVGFDLKTVHVKLEYRNAERTDRPYPGLKEFRKVRYATRDYALDPEDPTPPEQEED